MKTKITLLSLCILIGLQLRAQQKLITCSNQRNADGTISINVENKSFTDFTVKLVFTDLTGYSSNVDKESIKIVSTGTTELARLRRSEPATGHTFNYKYRTFPGHYFSKAPDTSFVYLLPSTANHTLRISKVSSIEERLGQKRTEDFFSTGFRYNLGDTICATRAGTVFNTVDSVKEGEKVNDFYKSGRNRISIEHKDGTIAHYSIVAPIKLLVAPGDEVIPGQPLAVFDRESPKYIVMFSVEYLDGKKLLADNGWDNTTLPTYFVYLPAHFYVNDDNKADVLQVNKQYTVMQPKQIIAAELTKKERKKMGLL